MREVIDSSGLDRKMDRLIKECPELCKRIVKKGTLASVGELKREAPVGKSVASNPWQPARTGGRMRSSITFEIIDNGFTGLAGPSVGYSRFVVEGTAPHDIYPRFKKALYWTGAVNPVSHVHHPGTRPNNFVKRAKDTMVNTRLPQISEGELKKSLAYIAGGM